MKSLYVSTAARFILGQAATKRLDHSTTPKKILFYCDGPLNILAALFSGFADQP
jgi:hypothetical protein